MSTAQNSLKQGGSDTLLLIDFDNAFLSLFEQFNIEEIDLERRLKKLNEWIEKHIGKILGGYGFIFAPEHLSPHHREMCVRNKLRIVICPKRQIDWCSRCETKPTNKEIFSKKCRRCLQAIEKKDEDTVDETIIEFGKIMLRHKDVKFLCLVSGDEDYVPLLEEAKENDIKVALVAPTLNSLSTNKVIIQFIDNHPKTGKKLVLRLDQI